VIISKVYCLILHNSVVTSQLFWDWSWQDLAEYDLLAMLSYVSTVSQSKILYVGHSQVYLLLVLIESNYFQYVTNKHLFSVGNYYGSGCIYKA
jgi:hypothetical protein